MREKKYYRFLCRLLPILKVILYVKLGHRKIPFVTNSSYLFFIEISLYMLVGVLIVCFGRLQDFVTLVVGVF